MPTPEKCCWDGRTCTWIEGKYLMYDTDAPVSVQQPGNGCLLMLSSRSTSPDASGITWPRPIGRTAFFNRRVVYLYCLYFFSIGWTNVYTWYAFHIYQLTLMLLWQVANHGGTFFTCDPVWVVSEPCCTSCCGFNFPILKTEIKGCESGAGILLLCNFLTNKA